MPSETSESTIRKIVREELERILKPSMPEAIIEKRGYTVAQAADYLGLSQWVLGNETRNNRIAAKKRGTTVLYDREELDRYFDDLPPRA